LSGHHYSRVNVFTLEFILRLLLLLHLVIGMLILRFILHRIVFIYDFLVKSI
jgi:hypothetical protein